MKLRLVVEAGANWRREPSHLRQGGYLIWLAEDVEAGEEGNPTEAHLLPWRSWRLRRVASSPLSAEAQALCVAANAAIWAQRMVDFSWGRGWPQEGRGWRTGELPSLVYGPGLRVHSACPLLSTQTNLSPDASSLSGWTLVVGVGSGPECGGKVGMCDAVSKAGLKEGPCAKPGPRDRVRDRAVWRRQFAPDMQRAWAAYPFFLMGHGQIVDQFGVPFSTHSDLFPPHLPSFTLDSAEFSLIPFV